MKERLRLLHLAAGLRCGEQYTCGKKVKYGTEKSANKAAIAMNKKPTTRNELEPYPCPFCEKWHVGRKMSEKELERLAKQ
jgi:hypothetical protein